MSLSIAKRLSTVKPSITLAVTAKALELKAKGVDIASFGAGEPDFDTPEHIKDAARSALDKDVSNYTNVRGLPELRKEIAEQTQRIHGGSFAAENVLVSCGAKHSLFNLIMATIDPGDEVVIPAPFWVSYPDMVRIAGGTPVIVPTQVDDSFMLSPEALDNAITDRTRYVIINNPSNPTGSVYTKERLRELAEICLKRKIYVVSDDIYRLLVYRGEWHSMARVHPEIVNSMIFIDGVSKAYAMTGWRIGYATGPVEVINAMTKIQGQATTNANHLAQLAALAALRGPQECVAAMREQFDKRRLRIVELLRAIPGVTCREPEGAFYAFPNLSHFLGMKTPEGNVIATDVDLASYLVDSGHVAIVPGSGFGAPGFARLSYASSMENIETGLGRMRETLSTLSA